MMQSKAFIKGTILLSFAGIITKVLSMFFRIPLIYLTGDEGVGYYQTFYGVFMLLVAIALTGMPQAVSKIVSEKVANENEEEAYDYFRSALLVLVIMGIALSIGLVFGANWLIRVSGWSKNTLYVIYSLSLSPVFICIAGAIKGYFQGKQIMKPTAVSQVIEGFTKVIIGIGLTYYLVKEGFEVHMAIAGAAIGTSISYVLSAMYLVIVWRRSVKNSPILKRSNNSNVFKFARYLIGLAVPITIGASAFSIMNFIDSLTLFHRLEVMGIYAKEATLIIGQIGKTFSVVNVPLTLSVALMISTVPAVAEANQRANKQELREAISTSLRLSMLLALPSAIGLGILSKPIMQLIYRENFLGYEYLQLYSICLFFLVLGQALASILQGLGRFMVPIWALVGSVIVKTSLNYFLIASPLLGKGALIGSIAFYMVFTIINYIVLVRILKESVLSIKDVLKPLVSASVMGIVVAIVFYLATYVGVGISIATIGAVALGGIIYLMLLYYTKCIQEEDIDVLPNKVKAILMKRRS